MQLRPVDHPFDDDGSSVGALVPGEVEVRWRTNPDTGSTASQRVTLTSGEERELAWNGKP